MTAETAVAIDGPAWGLNLKQADVTMARRRKTPVPDPAGATDTEASPATESADGSAVQAHVTAPTTQQPAAPSTPWIQLIELSGTNPSDEQLKSIVHEQIAYDLSNDPISAKYNVLFLFDSVAIARSDTDQLYRALSKTPRDKPLLLIINSDGGDVAAAYFIAKICREFTDVSFEVAVPRRAKSAATLICCGAEHIYMGSLSELGPIDPQFEGGVPALALKNSIEHLAELTKRHPQAADLFASYLSKTLRIEALGYYERVAESAAQYAERLLRGRKSPVLTEDRIKAIAERLVYMYKDHGFAIDAGEARAIFGEGVVLTNTPEYSLSNRLYLSLDIMQRVLRDLHQLGFAFTGTAAAGCQLRKRPRVESSTT